MESLQIIGPRSSQMARRLAETRRQDLERAELRAAAEATLRHVDRALSQCSRSRCSFCGNLAGRLGYSGRCTGCDAIIAQAEAETRRERALAPRNGRDIGPERCCGAAPTAPPSNAGRPDES